MNSAQGTARKRVPIFSFSPNPATRLVLLLDLRIKEETTTVHRGGNEKQMTCGYTNAGSTDIYRLCTRAVGRLESI